MQNLRHTEENLFGKDPHYTSMDNSEPGEDKDSDTMVTGTKGEAHLVKSCTETDSPSPPIGGGETPVQVRQAIPRNQAAAACLPMLLSSTNLISREVPKQHLGQAEQIKKLREEYLEKQNHLAVRFIEY